MPEMPPGTPKSVQSEFQTHGVPSIVWEIFLLRPVYQSYNNDLNQGYKGVHELDEACQQHDIAYATSSE